MPADFWLGVWSMLAAAAIVVACVLPILIVSGLFVRLGRMQLLPPWRPISAPWGAVEVVFSVAVVYFVLPATVAVGLTATGLPIGRMAPIAALAAAAGGPAAVGLESQAALDRIVLGLWTGVLSLPFQISLLIAASRVLYPSWWLTPRPPFAARIAAAVMAWFALTPLVLATNIVVNIVFTQLNWPTEPHIFTRLAGQTGIVGALFLIQACVAAPAIEEILFRGVILNWAIGRRKPVPYPDAPSRVRPILVMLMALLLAAMAAIGGETDGREASNSVRFGPFAFALLLTGGLAVLIRLCRRKRRTVAAVYSSAALFAMLHVSFWPTPIPLFLLGIGLGWLAVRTRSLLVPILVHGLFNAVSAVYMLRSPG